MTQQALALELPATSTEGRRARDRGIRKTEAVNAQWLDEAFDAMRRYCAGRIEVTCEEFRHWWLANGGREPSKHHAWGALGSRLKGCAWLRFERFQLAKSVKTHAHPVRVYAVVQEALCT